MTLPSNHRKRRTIGSWRVGSSYLGATMALGRWVFASVALWGVAVLACARDITNPVNTAPPKFIGVTHSLRTDSKFAVDKASRLSDYFCTAVVQGKDGRYQKGNVWLKMPNRVKRADSASVTRVVRVEWKPTGASSPQAGISCRIPDTKDAQEMLLTQILFIDPKTMKQASAANYALVPTAPTRSTSSLPVILVTANWTYPVSGSRSTSFVDYGASVPSWDPSLDQSAGYVAPGDPCPSDEYGNDYGVGYNTAIFWGSSSEMCPRTDFESICIDLYISTCRALILEGDCRNSDPNAPYSASRVQIVIAVNEALKDLGSTNPSPSCVYNPDISARKPCIPPLPAPYNATDVRYVTSDSIEVTYHLTNSVFQFLQQVIDPYPVPNPSIDGRIYLMRDPSTGTWRSAGERNNFPSLDIWYYNNGVRWSLAQRGQGSVFGLFDLMGWTDSWGCVCKK